MDDLNGGLCGFNNFGATCYLNSILQSLINNNHFIKYILTKNYIKNESIKEYDNLNPLIDEIEGIISEIWKENCIISPKSFVVTLSRMEKTNLNEQNDPDEFLEKILWKLHDETCIESSNTNYSFPYSELAKYLKNKDSFISDEFFGLYKSEIMCLECNHVSKTFNPYITLKLELINQNIIHCLKSHLSWEKDVSYKCEKCNCNSVKKRLTIMRVSNIFILTLKRYNNVISKKHTEVDFPTQFEIDGVKLELYAIINHFGNSIYCGHY